MKVELPAQAASQTAARAGRRPARRRPDSAPARGL